MPGNDQRTIITKAKRCTLTRGLRETVKRKTNLQGERILGVLYGKFGSWWQTERWRRFPAILRCPYFTWLGCAEFGEIYLKIWTVHMKSVHWFLLKRSYKRIDSTGSLRGLSPQHSRCLQETLQWTRRKTSGDESGGLRAAGVTVALTGFAGKRGWQAPSGPYRLVVISISLCLCKQNVRWGSQLWSRLFLPAI